MKERYHISHRRKATDKVIALFFSVLEIILDGKQLLK